LRSRQFNDREISVAADRYGRHFFGPYATGSTATKNIDVVVTHDSGSLLTTYAVKEISGKNHPAGMVYLAGQAFRRGDLPSGTYPVFRDATTHFPLVQQLDEIATRRENADDGDRAAPHGLEDDRR
jgi:hypothetical protein